MSNNKNLNETNSDSQQIGSAQQSSRFTNPVFNEQAFFDYTSVIKSDTAQVTKQWYLHPYTGVGPHSASFSQSLTNRDIINMYTQAGNYFYHSNCYSASYWTAALSYFQITADQVTADDESDEDIEESTSSKVQASKVKKTEVDLVSSLSSVDPQVRIYYSQINHIPLPIWNSTSSSFREVLLNSPKHRLTIGGRLVLPKEWKTMKPFDIARWGRGSAEKVNASGDVDDDVDLNTVDIWSIAPVDGQKTDGIEAPDFNQQEQFAYYTEKDFPSTTFPEALNIKVKDEKTGGFYTGNVDPSNTVPVRSVIRSYSMLPCDIDANRPIPTTNVYSQFMTKITKDQPDDAFRSMISRPAITDADARIWLAHNLSQLKFGSCMDVVPQVSAMLILHSLTKDRHFVDPVVLRTIRNKSISSWWPGLNISKRKTTDYPTLTMATSHLTYFIKYMARVVPVDTNFDPNLIDVDWVAVPVTSELLAVPTKLGAYVMCHLSSEYWNGTITWHRTSAYQQTEKQVPSGSKDKSLYRVGVEYFMPSSNSVYIEGVKKVWLVVVPSVSDAKATINLFGIGVPNSPDRNSKLVTKDMTQAWAEYWQGSDSSTVPNIITDFFWALTIMMRSTTTPDSTRRAVGLATELSNLAYPGVRVDPSDEGKPKVKGGAWTMGGTSVFKNKYESKDWCDGNDMPKNSDGNRKNRIAGFSFSSVSPNIQHAASYTELTQNLFLRVHTKQTGNVVQEVWVVDRLSQRWTSTKPKFNVPQYVANQATSISRLCAAVGFLETGGGAEYNFMNSYAVQQFLTHNGAAMFGNVSAMLVQNDIQPWIWLGYGYNDYPQFFDAYSNAFKQIYQSTVYPVNIHNLQISQPGFNWNKIVDYYSTDPHDQEAWMQFVPVPVCNYLQWINKLEIVQSPNTGMVQPIRAMGEEVYGLRITKETNDLKAKLFLMVNDRKTAWPQVRVFDSFETGPYNDTMWMDDYYYLSTAMIDPGQKVVSKWDKNAYLSSNTYARALSPGVLGYAAETVMVITSGLGLSRNDQQSIPHTTPVCLPDPPTAKSFLAQKIMADPEPPQMLQDPVPTEEEVKAVTDSVTPVTSTITQA
ncbi:MAG: hypothetical protein FuToV12_gp1 [Hangzhou sogatella furcifera totivirus 2]|nr:MAG: hypothetical protein FuToV12_gp1 [Hangzhou sogatella furcifera totivirus 2]